ncbi:MAG: carbonic anhydrase [Betaproteobacteria bacterium]
MTDRRRFVLALPALAASASAFGATSQECDGFTPVREAETSPDEALAMLKQGNARFVGGRTINCDLLEQLRDTKRGQAPFAAVLGCIDSSVPPELVLDQRIGDIVCARIAGNFINDDIIGSLEFSTKLSGAPLIVVLGHTECGAIKGAVGGVKRGYLTAMLRNFAPAIKAVRTPSDPTSKNAACVQVVADANAKIASTQLASRSEVLRALVDQKRLRIVAAIHDVATGRVTFVG